MTVFTTLFVYLLISDKPGWHAGSEFDQLALGSYLVMALGIVLLSLITCKGNLGLIDFFAMVP